MTPVGTDFEVLAFFLADHAVVENGKLYVNGGFAFAIGAPTFPTTIPISLAAVIQVPPRAYLQDHTTSIRLVDADGTELPIVIDARFRVGSAPDMRPGDPTNLPLALTFPINLVKVGDYSFVLFVDGAELARYPIRVVQEVPLVALSTGLPPSSSGGGDDPGPEGR